MIRNRNVVYISDPQNGKAKALEGVFRKHQSALRSFLRARLVMEADREDVVQEVFLKLTKVKDLDEKLSSDSGNTLSYLMSIATNLIVDIKRRAAVRRVDQHDSYYDDTSYEALSPTNHPTPETVAATSQQLDAMMEIMKKMKPKWREALMLNRFERMSYPEVAKEMGVSTTSVERYIANGLKVLRKEGK